MEAVGLPSFRCVWQYLRRRQPRVLMCETKGTGKHLAADNYQKTKFRAISDFSRQWTIILWFSGLWHSLLCKVRSNLLSKRTHSSFTEEYKDSNVIRTVATNLTKKKHCVITARRQILALCRLGCVSLFFFMPCICYIFCIERNVINRQNFHYTGHDFYRRVPSIGERLYRLALRISHVCTFPASSVTVPHPNYTPVSRLNAQVAYAFSRSHSPLENCLTLWICKNAHIWDPPELQKCVLGQ